jgi:small subunit ribosomal protein S1
MAPSRGSDESFASLFEQTAGATARQRRYHTGESVEVTIVAVAQGAVFADLGGKQEGYFEKPELSDADGKLRVEVGSRISAVVESVDAATGQVRLRPVVIRAESGDIGVAKAAGTSFVEGSRIKGKVTGVERYGVFVQIAGTQGRNGRGLIPAPETGTPRNADLKKHFSVGQDVDAKILNIDETGKIRLSISALGADDERGAFEAFKSTQGTQAAGASAGAGAAGAEGGAGAPRGKEKSAPRGFGTLADLLPKGAKSVPPPAKPKRAAPAPRAKGAAAGATKTPAKTPAAAADRAPAAPAGAAGGAPVKRVKR